ncbi:MAG: hypothetical protein ACYDG5_05225 [Dehalococcoidales bacterium]
MKLNIFDSGKSKNKKKPPKSAAAASQIAELEGQLSDWTSNLKKTEQRLKTLSGKVNETDELEVIKPTRPHGPIGELSLEADESADDEKLEGEDAENIKMFEVQPKPNAGDEASSTSNASIKDLFTSDDDDANPLAGLIQSLPEVTINELEDDLKEIKDIIKDWQKK